MKKPERDYLIHPHQTGPYPTPMLLPPHLPPCSRKRTDIEELGEVKDLEGYGRSEN